MERMISGGREGESSIVEDKQIPLSIVIPQKISSPNKMKNKKKIDRFDFKVFFDLIELYL